MLVEDLKKASKDELKNAAATCLRAYTEAGGLDKPAHLLEAQMYLTELDRRGSSFVSIRDLVLELTVIALIGWEIFEGSKQADVLNRQLTVLQTMQANAVTQATNDQAAMDKQSRILSSLQGASKATEDAMKNLVETSRRSQRSAAATAKTMGALQATTNAMSKATQGQLELFYDVALTVFWEDRTKQIRVVNNGRTNVTLAGARISNVELALPANNVLAPTAYYDLKIPFLDDAITTLAKGSTRSLPIMLYLRNEKDEEFVLEQNIDLRWENDQVIVRTQTVSIRPEKWSKPK